MDWLAILYYSSMDFQKIAGEIGGTAQLGHTDIFTDEMLASGSLQRSIPYPSQPL